MSATAQEVNLRLVQRLIEEQFPQWAALPLSRVQPGGWDNRTFRLGSQLAVRLPSAAAYAPQIEREFRWLPVLSPQVTQLIPEPVALGQPGAGYPWKWLVYRWQNGEPALPERVRDLNAFALDLAAFLCSLQAVPAAGGPGPGPETFHRGGDLAVYDDQVRQAIRLLATRIDRTAAIAAWEEGLASPRADAPVWVHGDISPGNLLVRDGRLRGVIDFGQCCVGDPACDLAIAWTFFDDSARSTFRAAVALDTSTWLRGRSWALWKALIVAARLAETTAWEGTRCWNTIATALAVRGAS